MSSVIASRFGDVAVLTLDNPPVNGFGRQQRRLLVEAIDAAATDPAVLGIVVTGAGAMFSGGADIREFGQPEAMASPHLLDVIAVAEACSKPVVAAINGTCMGGGLEFALGCHGRVALESALVALPEVKLGLLPGAGGTQRLPRAVGLENAMNMIVSGEPVPAKMLAKTALFDAVVEQDVVAAAAGVARKLASSPQSTPKVRDYALDDADVEAFIQFTRTMVQAQFPREPARLQCVEAVAGALKPFDEGLLQERRLFAMLMATPESQALRHAFFAERAASKIPDVPADTPTRAIARVGVIGAGTMGGGICMNFLNAGIPVTLLETAQEALDRGVTTIRRNYDNSARKGKLKPEQVDRRMALLHPTLDFAQLADCDLVIEAVFETMEVKREVFLHLDAVAKPGAILASNTSTLDLDAIAGFTKRPQDIVGLHFFSPANVMKLLEVVRGKATSKDVLATVMKVAKTIRKTAVVSGVCDGFIGNRMIEHYGRMANFLVEEGASPQQVDRALEAWGMAMGPYRMADLAGNDIGWAIRKRRYVEKPAVRYSALADRLCERGRFGQKTGAGWYRYEPGKRDALPDPEVDALILDYRREIGVTPRPFRDAEIVERCIYALVNEGARLLSEGIAQRASDIDLVYLAGYGFPAWRGGPMGYADSVGLAMVARRMRQFAAQPRGDTAFWQPAPLLVELATQGKTFSGA
ncbi:MAG: enoyl-CoA hydratase/isomerase family protein [Betaproteobacteria bacterium]|nr:enoyl-CoA hydratase/isomerase family protein [Betaproteobacteria bacterium]MDE2123685.1 enoyl-CoA hydratase/isomerase family protein [Betaproteobacteria bacterium]MDE2187156.1 enoyl-CoA hydratase/isomerase family protein [Betaproteobacteria bacterium]MDE2324565.1 enoyl-CoA hydratase/isomerase family protein [Betaproteobacteria bacterium]